FRESVSQLFQSLFRRLQARLDLEPFLEEIRGSLPGLGIGRHPFEIDRRQFHIGTNVAPRGILFRSRLKKVELMFEPSLLHVGRSAIVAKTRSDALDEGLDLASPKL